jgi:hypothetical protein
MALRLKRLKKTLAKVGTKVGRIAQYALPIAGAVLGGAPLALAGGLAGSVARGATAKGGRKGKLKAAVKAAGIGASVAGGAAALGLLSGAGAGASVLDTAKAIFAPGKEGGEAQAAVQEAAATGQPNTEGAYEDFLTRSDEGLTPQAPGADEEGAYDAQGNPVASSASDGRKKMLIIGAVGLLVVVGGILFVASKKKS